MCDSLAVVHGYERRFFSSGAYQLENIERVNFGR